MTATRAREDVTGGWAAAAGMLAGLCAQAATRTGQYVTTSLLGAGLLLHSGVLERDGEVVPRPGLDAAQTGSGPGYRSCAAAPKIWPAPA